MRLTLNIISSVAGTPKHCIMEDILLSDDSEIRSSYREQINKLVDLQIKGCQALYITYIPYIITLVKRPYIIIPYCP